MSSITSDSPGRITLLPHPIQLFVSRVNGSLRFVRKFTKRWLVHRCSGRRVTRPVTRDKFSPYKQGRSNKTQRSNYDE